MSMAADVAETLSPQRATAFDAEAVRRQFPALSTFVHQKPLVYLDNAATTQKPQCVLEALERANTLQCANIHRGVHWLSAQATEAYEGTRKRVQRFLNAPSADEVVFVRGTTEGINLVAHSYAREVLRPGDEIVLSGLEHHSNIVPWQLACQATGARIVVAPLDAHGDVPLAHFERAITDKTRIVAVSHVSNALGTVLPVADIAKLAHDKGAVLVVDGAQAAPHGPTDVQALGCDFYAFSGHKVYGPTGSGVLWGKAQWLERMVPFQGGGDMIETVTFEKSTWAKAPHKFEAGTPDISGVIGLGAAVDFLGAIDWQAARAHEAALTARAERLLDEVPGLVRIGTAARRLGVVSFTLEAAHPHDVGTIVDLHGVAVRTGHHCAQPVMRHFGITATTRASVGLYNTPADIDTLAESLHAVVRLFS